MPGDNEAKPQAHVLKSGLWAGLITGSFHVRSKFKQRKTEKHHSKGQNLRDSTLESSEVGEDDRLCCDCRSSVNNPKKSAPMLNETYLGLLYPAENYKVYGYLTNTKVKLILVTMDLNVRDAGVRNFFRKFHAAFVDAVSNPFHVPGKKITSRTFAERASNIVKSFGLSSEL
ncbi:TRAFFICKING PROTEIN PARTICLE COMPLEX SUBUNIT 2 [Salix purpurea]|uniref:Trafficking protein particle complex subunit 2-like protein n=1 Tax=Salix purpurea TaxID=77065 RepID=A0A9Q1ACC7_SALPP|nr:TRAFFICKING PROTEIN PARTICLE COMPLEX SUBUNIT 2 [Salix purpurea]